jgi:hypothetical protein
MKGAQVEQRSGMPFCRLGDEAKERMRAWLRTPRFSRDTRRTLPPCSTLLVELTISCLVLYCRYTVFPRTCHAWAEAQTKGGKQVIQPREAKTSPIYHAPVSRCAIPCILRLQQVVSSEIQRMQKSVQEQIGMGSCEKPGLTLAGSALFA